MTNSADQASALDAALDAGVAFALSGSLLPTSALAVNDVCKAAGIGVSAFYRAFESVAEFNLAIVERTIVQAFETSSREFFSDLGDRLGKADLSAADPYRMVIDQYLGTVPEVLDDPLNTVWAWLSHESSAVAIRDAAQDRLPERAELYEAAITMLGGSLRDGTTAWQVAAIHMAASKVFEQFAAIAPPELKQESRIAEADLFYEVLAAALSNPPNR